MCGPIACFRRSESRFSGQKGPRSSEMRVYIETTGHINISSKFPNFILVPGVQKTDFYDFSGIFLRKNGPGIWESRVRRPGNLEWNVPAALGAEVWWPPATCTGRLDYVLVCVCRLGLPAWPLLKKSVKRKIRYHVKSLPAADNGFPGHDNPPVRASRAGTEFFIKIYFWTGTRWVNSS